MTITCPWCGPFETRIGTGCETVREGDSFAYICPRCDMTAGEHAYRERILADSAAVLADEHRAFQAQRRTERVA